MGQGVGQVVGGRYRLDELLGQGGMGAVYAATQLGLERRCAVKVLHDTLSRDGELVARFKREAEVAASLGHPNIVQVTDFGYDDGVAWLVMDLLKGTSLADAISREPLAPERVRFIAAQVLSALEAAHARGIVHRDLKPDNIFLTSVSGVRDVVKLLDFGIARLTGEQSHKMTTTGQVLGTPAYMSPEQARGRPVDARTDLYSLGVVMYEALCGRMPVSGSNYHELMFNIVDATPPRLQEIVPTLPAGLVAVVERAMAKDRNARYPSAAAMRADLDALGPVQPRALPATASSSAPATMDPGAAAQTDPLAATMTPEAVAAVASSSGAPSPRLSGRMGAAAALALLAVGFGAYSLLRSNDAPPSTAVAAAVAAPAVVVARADAASPEEAAIAPSPEAPPAMDAVEATEASLAESPTRPTAPPSEAPGAPDGPANTSPMRSRPPRDPLRRPARLRRFSSEPHPPLPHRAGTKAWEDAAGTPIVWARCGDAPHEVYPVLASTRVTSSGGTNPGVVARESFRSVRERWAGVVGDCYRGRASLLRGQRLTASVDATGRVTGVRMSRYCPVPAAAAQCVEEGLVGQHVPPGDRAPGEIEVSFGIAGAM